MTHLINRMRTSILKSNMYKWDRKHLHHHRVTHSRCIVHPRNTCLARLRCALAMVQPMVIQLWPATDTMIIHSCIKFSNSRYRATERNANPLHRSDIHFCCWCILVDSCILLGVVNIYSKIKNTQILKIESQNKQHIVNRQSLHTIVCFLPMNEKFQHRFCEALVGQYLRESS